MWRSVPKADSIGHSAKPSTRKMSVQLVVATVALGMVTSLLSVVGAAPASAALAVRVVNTGGDGVSSRSAPQLSARNGYGAPEGASITTVCQTWGDAVGPYNNRLWWLISYSGRQFYAPDRYLSTPTKANVPIGSEPWCGTSPAPAPAPAPAPGGAPATGTYVSSSTPVRFCIDDAARCAPRWTIPVNTTVTMVCWQKGANLTGEYRTDMWFVVSHGDREGWVHASRVKRQTSVPFCGNVMRIKAELLGTTYYGQNQADGATAGLFSAADWGNPYAEWSGDCVKLGWAAWHFAGRDPLRGNAYPQYQAYANAGKIRTTGTPPMGALVFFKIAMPYGHVALSTGGGFVITTRGMDGDGARNEYKPISSYPNYLGWALPA